MGNVLSLWVESEATGACDRERGDGLVRVFDEATQAWQEWADEYARR